MMTRHLRLPLSTAALAATAFLATAASAPAASSTGTVRVPYKVTVPVTGATGKTGVISTSLPVPTSWKRQKSKGTPVWLAGHGTCVYRVTTKATLTLAPSSSAFDRVVAEAPAVGPRVLENGTRNTAAWRVTRPLASNGVYLRSVRAVATAATSGLTVPPGQSLWLEVWLEGLSRPGSECHAGTYRNTLGPQFGDALATLRTRSYIQR